MNNSNNSSNATNNNNNKNNNSIMSQYNNWVHSMLLIYTNNSGNSAWKNRLKTLKSGFVNYSLSVSSKSKYRIMPNSCSTYSCKELCNNKCRYTNYKSITAKQMTIFVLYMACFHGWQYNYNNNSLMNKSTAFRGYHNRYNQNCSFTK